MPTEPGTPLRLEAFLPYQLSVLSNTVSAAIAGAYSRRFDLSIPEWRVMAVVGRYPGLSAVEVAERTAMDKVAVSRAVGRLLKAGRLTRRIADADRRRSILELSARGRSLYQQITPLALQYERTLLDTLSEPEQRQLALILDKLLSRARHLGTPGAEQPPQARRA